MFHTNLIINNSFNIHMSHVDDSKIILFFRRSDYALDMVLQKIYLGLVAVDKYTRTILRTHNK